MKTKILTILLLLGILPLVNAWGVGYVIDANEPGQLIDIRGGLTSSGIYIVHIRPYPNYVPDENATVTMNCSPGAGFSANLSHVESWGESGYYANVFTTSASDPFSFEIQQDITEQTLVQAQCTFSTDSDTQLYVFINPVTPLTMGGFINMVDDFIAAAEEVLTGTSPYETPSAALDTLVIRTLDIIAALFDLIEILIIFIVLVILPISMITITWKVILFLVFKWS